MESLEYNQKMREIYLNTEKQFLEFNEWVPFETNDWEINSTRLYFILITTCGQIEALMKKICEELKISPKEENFAGWYEALNHDRVLYFQQVSVIRTNDTIKPFNENNSNHFWWKNHNKAKHELPEGILHGTIKNVIYALAALNGLHKILTNIPYDEPKIKLLESKYWMNHTPITVAEGISEQDRYHSPRDSEIFLNNSQYYGHGGL